MCLCFCRCFVGGDVVMLQFAAIALQGKDLAALDSPSFYNPVECSKVRSE